MFLINVFSLNVGILIGAFGVILGILLYSVIADLKSKRVNPKCKCGSLVHLGSWVCEIHGNMVAHKDSRRDDH